MKRKQLGCLTTGGLIALIVALVVVGTSYAFTRNKMFSPGDLNAQIGQPLGGVSSHAELIEECAACHPAPWDGTDMADLCIDCHQDVIEQLANRGTLHGAAMGEMGSQNCRACHTEHNGAQASLTQFLRGDFPHHLVGFALNAHERIDWEREVVCADCHQDNFTEFDRGICADCHQQVHPSFMQEHTALFGLACLDCHDGLDTYGADFDHNQQAFKLEGKHAALGCEQCHQGAVNISMLKNTPQACESCHLEDDAHEGNLGTQCAVCHIPVGWTPAEFDHSKTGFLLVGGHERLECENCHETTTFQGQDPACIACHAEDEPHNGQFGTDCAACHVVTSWEEINFDHSGAYAQDCASCHQPDKPANHYPGQCSACHSTDAWLPAAFDHAVAGATDCLSCHTGDKPANHFGGQCSACHNTNAWLPASFNHSAAGATDCLSCHTGNRPANHFTGQCSTCHNTNAWKPASFAHTFPLNHGGANQQCQLCHNNNNFNSYTCYNCHEHNPTKIQNEHEGVANLNNCVRCHWDGREHDDDGGNGGGGNNND